MEVLRHGFSGRFRPGVRAASGTTSAPEDGRLIRKKIEELRTAMRIT